MELSTGSLLIREFNLNDVDAIHRISNTDGFHFYSLDGSKEKSENFVMRAIGYSIQGRARKNFKMAVSEQKNPFECIGYVAFDDLHAPENGTPDIGYLIDPKYQGKGYATEAMSRLMGYCYEHFPHMDVSWLTVHPDNRASQKVAEKLGFRRISDTILEKYYGPRYEYKTERSQLRRLGII
jgi:RimJ/RimL family protein N-acetyltransferase